MLCWGHEIAQCKSTFHTNRKLQLISYEDGQKKTESTNCPLIYICIHCRTCILTQPSQSQIGNSF